MAAKRSKIQPEPGYTTTEFWTTIATDVLAVLSVIFHSDFHGVAQYIPIATIAAAGAGHIVYSIMRTHHKSSALTCLFEALQSVPGSELKQLLADAEVLEPKKSAHS